jgi:hypothetical protein
MFLILAPRATPLGPPKFVHAKEDTEHHEAGHVEHTEEDAVATIGGASA